MQKPPTRKVKPSQRCPACGKVHKEWADLSNRYHVCDCGFSADRDRSSGMVMYNVATNRQLGLGTRLSKDVDVAIPTPKTSKNPDKVEGSRHDSRHRLTTFFQCSF